MKARRKRLEQALVFRLTGRKAALENRVNVLDMG